MPPPGAYRALSSFEMENRTALPKTNYYTFDKSATREQMNKTYNPLDNSPRGVDIKQMPGPGHYSFKNNSVGTGGRHFSFLQKTKYAQGKLSDRFEREKTSCGLKTLLRDLFKCLASVLQIIHQSPERIFRFRHSV